MMGAKLVSALCPRMRTDHTADLLKPFYKVSEQVERTRQDPDRRGPDRQGPERLARLEARVEQLEARVVQLSRREVLRKAMDAQRMAWDVVAQVFQALMCSGMCGHGLRTLFPPWCCLAQGLDPKNDPRVLASLFDSAGCLVNSQLKEWRRILDEKSCANVAIPLAAAKWLVGHRALWAAEDSVQYMAMATPHGSSHGGATQPAETPFSGSLRDSLLFREPLLFQDAFQWFPAGFPWSSPQRRYSLVLQGGAAAHMLHKRGFGDLDFAICSQGGGCLSHSDDAAQLVAKAVMSLSAVSARTLLVQRHDRLTFMMHMPDGRKWRVQFLLRIFRSISEILLSADVDVTQVVYHGTADARPGLYLSPLALEAFSGGVITIRSMPISTTFQRIGRYVSRGFGVRAATLLRLPANMFLQDEEENDADMFTHGCSGPDRMWEFFSQERYDYFLAPIWNKMMCYTKKNTSNCPICVPLERQQGYHSALSQHWSQQWVYDMPDHLAHLKLRNARSTRQFLCKDDKCSLPNPSRSNDLLQTT